MKKIFFILACLILIFIVFECNNKQPEVNPKDAPAFIPSTGNEPEPERKLFTLSAIETSFDKNYNDIDSIAAEDNKVYYYSKAGRISYGKRSDSWKIDTIPYKRLQKNSEKNVPQDVPGLFKRSSYAGVSDRCEKNNYEIVLMWYGSEGCYGSSAVFDTVRNTVFYPGNQLYKSVSFDDENIYLGQPYGFSIVSRKDETINDYAFLPYLSRQSNLHVSDDKIWIAADRIGIQRIDKSNGSALTFWSYRELADLIDSAEIRKTILESYHVRFTNFCENDSLLFIGYKTIGDYYFEYTHLAQSFLLIYNKLSGQWQSVLIDKMKALKYIFMAGSKVWLGGNHPERSEGDIEPLCHGGVAVYDIAEKKVHYFNEIPYALMVYDFRKENDGTIIYTYDYDRSIYKYKISENYQIDKADAVKYEYRDALHNEVKSQILKKSQSEYGTNLYLLKDIKIRLQIVRLNKQPVKLYKQPYHNWKRE